MGRPALGVRFLSPEMNWVYRMRSQFSVSNLRWSRAHWRIAFVLSDIPRPSFGRHIEGSVTWERDAIALNEHVRCSLRYLLVPYCPAVTPPLFATCFQEKEGGGRYRRGLVLSPRS